MMLKNLTRHVLWAQGVFLVLFAVFAGLMLKGGLFSSYCGLMSFAAGGSAVAVLTMFHDNTLLGLSNVLMIILSFFFYALAV